MVRAGMIVAALVVGSAVAQPAAREPQLGYVYPAGGQQGSTFTVLTGGQLLRGAAEVYVSGEGVRATVEQYYRPLRNINQEQRQEIVRRMMARRDALLGEAESGLPGFRDFLPRGAMRGVSTMTPVALPPHPMLDNIDKMSLAELAHARHLLVNLSKRQLNVQLAELVTIKVQIEPGAAPGAREIRLLTAAGLTNPMRFEVGALPEVSELEPNDPGVERFLPPDAPHALPVTINGQITPGDVDRFAFQARRGQRLVIQAQARGLIPYLADAVPGWFQATLALYDPHGAEVAFGDDFRFDADPVLVYEVAEDGVYEIEIRDAIYRGRDDFVYRIRAREQQQAVLPDERAASVPAAYAVDALPECVESEPNADRPSAQRLALPQIVNGRIARPGDVDVFALEGRAGDAVVAEVTARRLQSPLDSLVRLVDAAGHVVAWNDDHEDKEHGLLTHHADSYLAATLPQDGVYYVEVADAQRQGGTEYTYRLRVSGPRPDFALRITPSSLNIHAGRVVPVTVHALRKDGFDGDIEVVLKDAPTGFTLSGGRIAAGHERARMTIGAPPNAPATPVALRLEGRAQFAGATVRRDVVPAEDMMQAFAYRHLVPAKELLAVVPQAGRRGPPVRLATPVPLHVIAGGTAEVRIVTPPNPRLEEVRLELDGAPPGVKLHDLRVISEGLAFSLSIEDQALPIGYRDNVIVEGSTEAGNPRAPNAAARPPQRVSLGFLPAIPIEVVAR